MSQDDTGAREEGDGPATDRGDRSGQLRVRLQRFGFSEKEVDAYLSIVDRGRAKPSTIAEAADVSTSYVYELCEQLEANGLVSVEDHRTPTVVQAKPPSAAFDRLIEDLQSVSETVAQRYEQPAETEAHFTVIKSRPTLLKALEAAIDEADEEIAIQVSDRVLSDLRPALERAVDRGVMVLLVLVTDRESIGDLDLAPVADVVRVGIAGMPTFVSVDQRIGAIAPPEVLDWTHSEEAAISFVQEQVAPILVGSFLGNYWPLSEEMLVCRPRDLPRTYDSFRPAIFDATQHLRAGHDIHARIRGRPARTTQEYQDLDGEVVDTSQSLVAPCESAGFEETLYVDRGEETITVGGQGAFLEAYEARRVRLVPGDS